MPSQHDSTIATAETTLQKDLFARTLRTVAILVGVCVLFVGGLSAAAVAIASRAVGAPQGTVDVAPGPPMPAAPMNTSAPSRSRAAGTTI